MELESSASNPETPGMGEEPPEQAQPPTGESSATPAETEGAKQSPLDIVKAALDARRAQAETVHRGDAPETPADAKGSDSPRLPAKPDDSETPHPDDKQTRNFKALREELASFKERAERFDQLSRYLQDSAATQDDFATALTIMRLIKQDPEQALKAIVPIVEHLQQVAGEKLPADLVDKVDRGLIDEETAHELSRARSRAQMATTRAEELQQRRQQELEQARGELEARERAAAASQIGLRVSAWERQWEASDPDYKAKHRLVADRVQALMAQEGVPTTPEAAIAQAEKAKREIDEWYASTVGPRKQPVTTVTGGAGTSTRSAPRTPLDVTKAALGVGH